MIPSLAELRHIHHQADCLADQASVEAAIDRIAAAITARLSAQRPVIYVVMNGGLVFAGQLLTRLDFPLEVAYLHATRYRQQTQGAELQWQVAPTVDPHGRCALVIDDILDEGHTLLAIVDALRAAGADEVLTAVLLDKRHERKARPDLRADFHGLEVVDRYLYGYGMDYQGWWRNANGIYAVKGL